MELTPVWPELFHRHADTADAAGASPGAGSARSREYESFDQIDRGALLPEFQALINQLPDFDERTSRNAPTLAPPAQNGDPARTYSGRRTADEIYQQGIALLGNPNSEARTRVALAETLCRKLASSDIGMQDRYLLRYITELCRLLRKPDIGDAEKILFAQTAGTFIVGDLVRVPPQDMSLIAMYMLQAAMRNPNKQSQVIRFLQLALAKNAAHGGPARSFSSEQEVASSSSPGPTEESRKRPRWSPVHTPEPGKRNHSAVLAGRAGALDAD